MFIYFICWFSTMFFHLISSRAESPIGDSRPVERAIEARNGSEDGQGSMVRCLHFAHTYIANRKFRNIIDTLCYGK